MGEFELKFNTDNAAFQDGQMASECWCILSYVQSRITMGQTSGPVRDSNGITVGHWRLDVNEEEQAHE